MVEIKKDGYLLHNRYAYPAFASVGDKYKESLPLILRNTRDISNLPKLIEFYQQNCSYLLTFVHPPFKLDDVRNYWLGNSPESHTNVKFRDWFFDTFLNEEILIECGGSPQTVREMLHTTRSVRCDIDELNNCTVMKAKIIDSKKHVVEFDKYVFKDQKLYLEKTRMTINPLLIGELKEERIAVHQGYGIEYIFDNEENRTELIDCFNKRDAEGLAKRIILLKEYIEAVFKRI